MNLKLLFVVFILYVINSQIEALEQEVNETIINIEDFQHRINKLTTSLNNNYENLKPEEKFAAHLIKIATKQILNFFKADILNGVHNLEEISNTTNFDSCTDNINLNTIMEMYDNCIDNSTSESAQNVALNLTETLIYCDSKLSEITHKSNACNLTSDVSHCNAELAESMQRAYEDILIKVNEANALILSNYRNVVKEMPSCATRAFYHVIDMGDIFKCLILLVKNNP